MQQSDITITRQALAALMVERLRAEHGQFSQAFNTPLGTRTRHFICDNLLPQEIAGAISDAFPKDFSGFKTRSDFRERKRTSVHLDNHLPILKEVTFAFQSPEVIREIGAITGMTTLEPDPKLYAGGLSMMIKGDYLHPHIDNSHDSARQRYRRLNLLYYVSLDWTDANGGNFELWNDSVTEPRVIVSEFNRLVIMETNGHSCHSVNEIACDRPRCCVSNYFFSKDSPTGKEYYHVTAFKGRPGRLSTRAFFFIDAALRNIAARTLKIGRGRQDVYVQHDADIRPES
jgi:Rps23 Pro-64 3,4-dihydroxylase Tpa1-like proline 4-hydroxylase